MAEPFKVEVVDPPTPDEFFDLAFARISAAISGNEKVGNSVTFAEGSSFASDVARGMTSEYRRIVWPESR